MINFKGRHFPKDIILLCVRWYVSYPLSYRNLEEMMQERGIFVNYSTLNRWVVHYSLSLKPYSTSGKKESAFVIVLQFLNKVKRNEIYIFKKPNCKIVLLASVHFDRHTEFGLFESSPLILYQRVSPMLIQNF